MLTCTCTSVTRPLSNFVESKPAAERGEEDEEERDNT